MFLYLSMRFELPRIILQIGYLSVRIFILRISFYIYKFSTIITQYGMANLYQCHDKEISSATFPSHSDFIVLHRRLHYNRMGR